MKNIWAKVALCGVQNAGVSKPNLRPPVAGRRRPHLGLHKGEGLMPYSSLFEFLRVKNIWAKVTLCKSEEYLPFLIKALPNVFAFWSKLLGTDLLCDGFLLHGYLQFPEIYQCTMQPTALVNPICPKCADP